MKNIMSFFTQKRFWIPVSFVLLIFIGIAGFILFSPSSAPAAPVINWTPESVTETISPGGSKVVNVSFTSTENLSNVEVWVVPELQPYIQFQPSSFAQITKGQTISVSMTFSANWDSQTGLIEGTIHIRQGRKTIAKPLPVKFDVTFTLKKYQNDEVGFSLIVPSTFIANIMFT